MTRRGALKRDRGAPGLHAQIIERRYEKMSFLRITAVLVALALLTGSAPARAANIVDVAASNPDFSTLVAAVKAAGLVDTLANGGPFTVFAPTNKAFQKLPKGTVESLLKPENKDKLVAVLTYHVVPGTVKAADVAALENGTKVETVNGADVVVKQAGKNIFLNKSKVIATDVLADNGVIHVIDTVLIPPADGKKKADKAAAGGCSTK